MHVAGDTHTHTPKPHANSFKYTKTDRQTELRMNCNGVG